MQYTVSYTTSPDYDYLAHTVVDVPAMPWDHATSIPENSVKAKFDEIFRFCFGNTLNYRITKIQVGSHYGPPMRIK
jgi:hypothetical protein